METSTLTSFLKKYPLIWGGVLLSCMSVFLILNTLSGISDKKINIMALQEQLQIYQKNIQASSHLTEDIESIQNLAKEASQSLIQARDTTKIFSFFLKLEKKTAVQMKDPVLLGVIPVLKNSEDINQIIQPVIKTTIARYQIDLSGHLKNIFDYVQELNAMDGKGEDDYYSRLVELDIQRDIGTKEPNMVSASLVLYILGRDE